jgi:hypothetical protein
MTAHPVIVPVLQPMTRYHRRNTANPRHSVCGLPTHGWYEMTVEQARDNADQPCPLCFP